MSWSIFQQGGGQGAAVTWAHDLLSQIGAPQSDGNIQLIYDWEVSEGAGGQYNPLNQGPDPKHPDWSGGSQFGGGASDYTSYQTGLGGASDYLHMPAYHGILSNLQSDNPGAARNAIIASPWAKSHYGWGSAFSSDPVPGHASALQGNPGSASTVSSVGCPSFLSNPVAWAGCQSAKGAITSLGGNGLANFLLDPVDALERIGLVIFGAILIIVGILILGLGPALGVVRGAQGAKKTLLGGSSSSGGSSEPPEMSPERKAENDRRLTIAERNADMGERKIALKEAREQRLSAGKYHPRGKREPNPSPQHST